MPVNPVRLGSFIFCVCLFGIAFVQLRGGLRKRKQPGASKPYAYLQIGLSLPLFLWMIFILMGQIAKPGYLRSLFVEPIPEVGIPESEMNTELRLTTPQAGNTFKSGDPVRIDVEVVGKQRLAFPADYKARIFIREDQRWVEVPNGMKYPPVQPYGYFKLSPANGDHAKHGAVTLDPIFPHPDQAAKLCIILVGNVVRGEQITDDYAAGYVSVELAP